MPASNECSDTVYRPERSWFWFMAFLSAVLIAAPVPLGVAFALKYPKGGAWPMLIFESITAPLGLFLLLTGLGFLRQEIRIQKTGVALRLIPRMDDLLLPWRLRWVEIPWDELLAIDIRLRVLWRGGPRRAYVLRTAKSGTFCYFPAQWKNARELQAELRRRSGAPSHFLDLDASATP